MTKDEKLGQSVQGFLLKEKDGKKIRVPHIGFSANLDYLNEFVNRLYNKFEKIKGINIVKWFTTKITKTGINDSAVVEGAKIGVDVVVITKRIR